MHSFQEWAQKFQIHFQAAHFPEQPRSLYEPASYILTLGGKRIRPLLVLMGNELFDEINPDAWHVATAIELFHNFSLVHDDIMDKAPLRRGMQTVHKKYGESTALLAGDVMLVQCYEYLNKIKSPYLHKIISLFNRTAKEVCEGQQLDMDFEQEEKVSLEEYERMIALKTSVLLAAALQMGAVLGGASEGNQLHLYEFGKAIGLAFQVQDDYLDAFGDPNKVGKQVGGDILANKKTFLMIKALEMANANQAALLAEQIQLTGEAKVQAVLSTFKAIGVDAWANALKGAYFQKALDHLEAIAVTSGRKKMLQDLAAYLLDRDH